MKKGLIIFGIFVVLLACTLIVIFPLSDALSTNNTTEIDGSNTGNDTTTPTVPDVKPDDDIIPEVNPDDIVPGPDGETEHSFTFDPSDYMLMVTCENEGCQCAMRQEGEHTYDDMFCYDFSATRKEEIEGNLQEFYNMLDYVGEYNSAYHGYDPNSELKTSFDTLMDLFANFSSELDYLYSQYQNAYLLYYIKICDENALNYAEITDYYNEKSIEYYLTFRLIYDSAYREYFVNHYGESNALYYVSMSDSYSSGNTSSISKRLGEIEVEFLAIEDEKTSDLVPVLYEEFVDLNNQLATTQGYDNYIEYAYGNSYGRSYGPEDANVMRSYVKEYISDVYFYAVNCLQTYSSLEMSDDALNFYTALTDSVIFDSVIANNLVHDYFISMSSTENSGEFFTYANNLFKNGNYYRGERESAFSWTVNSVPILYFGPGTYYSGAFTFVHEFGHYYNNNAGRYNSIDTAEIHSQGNEMMFLAYLETCLSANILNDMYAVLYYTQLTDMLGTILLASCVDEFEYCVYTGTTPDGQPAEYTAEDYDDLFISIMDLYGIATTFRTTYWRSVTILHSGYYISYAMSALPSIEILSIAGEYGYEYTKDIYFKTQFTRNSDFESFLIEVGLTSVFDENLYINLLDYFVNNPKDFSY